MKTPERWQQVKEILYAALETDPAERGSLLDEKCLGDDELREEVESLIYAHGKAAERFESPALDAIAAEVSKESSDAVIGTSISHYLVIEKLGSGGMGEVFLAEDTRLGRKVALKLLPSFFTQDRSRVRRFQQEARAASALNHPNILTIHEIGHVDSIHYIATEYVDGETLRTRMGRGPLATVETLDIAIHVASALATAHDAGIVHRDIKPENIMIRRDRIAKVLDFGLAKLTERPERDVEASAMVNTDEGVVIGTAQYMSPEQARGLQIDARTDIWSLGCVLYEMLAGRGPFTGPTPSDVVACILEREPSPLSRHAENVPRQLQRIITKALAKDREQRYQSIRDLLIDLRHLRDEIQFEAKLEYSAQPSSDANALTERQPFVENTDAANTRTSESIAAQPTSSAEYIVGQIKQHKKRLAVAAAALLVTLVAVSYGSISLYLSYRQQSDPPKQPVVPSQTMKMTRLTSSGTASQAAISPDGRFVVHVSSQDGQQYLRVRQVNTSNDMQLVPPADVQYTGLTFSRDGDHIYYVIADNNNTQSTLYQVSSLGGTARKLISNVGSQVTFAPDGKSLAFIRRFVEQGVEAVMVANADGSAERRIAVRKFPNFFRSVSWSPDGRTIACGAGSYVPVYNSYVVEVPVDGGPEKPIISNGWTFIGEVEWLHDGAGLILAASERASASFDSQIWILSRQGGEIRRVTTDLNNYSGVSLTADSSRLVAVQSETFSNVWLIPTGDTGRATPVTQGIGKRDGKDGTVWTPDGKIIYASKASGNDDIWIMDANGRGLSQLTTGVGMNSNPSVSPDGGFIVFTSTRDGAAHIWRMDIDGSNPKQLTSGSGENDPQISPDGKWVVYTLFAGKPTIWRVSIDGGAPEPISDETLSAPAVSPNGKLVAAIYRDDQPTSPARIAVIPFEGGAITKILELPHSAWHNIRWTPDGKAVTYVATSAGVSNIWSQDLAGGAPRQLTDFKSDQIFSFNWSIDGKHIVASRGVETNDVVLLTSFR